MTAFVTSKPVAKNDDEVANQQPQTNLHQPFFRPVNGGNDLFIQRQPNQNANAVKKPNLSSVSAKDPASSKSDPGLINAALLASKYAKYIGNKFKGDDAIDAKGKFVIASSQQNFVNEYNKCYGTNVTTLSGTNGFYCFSKRTIHLIPNAEFGTAFHESVHKASALVAVISNTAWLAEKDFAFDLNEGLTSFYTKDILESDYQVKNYIDGYATQRKKAAALIQSLGEDEVAKFYFQYNFMPLLAKFGITTIKGDMNNVLVSKLKAAF
jgi:hypothetical protein